MSLWRRCELCSGRRAQGSRPLRTDTTRVAWTALGEVSGAQERRPGPEDEGCRRAMPCVAIHRGRAEMLPDCRVRANLTPQGNKARAVSGRRAKLCWPEARFARCRPPIRWHRAFLQPPRRVTASRGGQRPSSHRALPER